MVPYANFKITHEILKWNSHCFLGLNNCGYDTLFVKYDN